jgi:hypothetical protein
MLKLNFFKGADLKDPKGLFNAGLDAKTARAIRLEQRRQATCVGFERPNSLSGRSQPFRKAKERNSRLGGTAYL